MKRKVPLFDSLGRPIWFDREEFRDHVIPENLKAEWDNPQELYDFVVQIFRDGFIEEAERGADRLLELYQRDEGTLVLKAAVLLRKGDDVGAEKLLLECIGKYPDRGVAHTFLARVYSRRGDREGALSALMQGLRLEPNQEMALRWLVELHQEKKEDPVAALKPFAEIAGAFWPQLELGRLHLEADRISEAIRWFEAAVEVTRGLRREQEPPSYDEEMAVMTSTAKLLQRGLRDEVIEFCRKFWLPTFATPFAGLDYVQALEEAGRVQEGIGVLKEMLPYLLPEYRSFVDKRLHHLESKSLVRGR
ncbi:tetratricopeptide repeat protein [Planifilum fimeticola]